jgi:hypothetical protein
MRYVISIVAVIGISGAIPCSSLAQQYPMLDELVGKVIEKYQTSSCQQLAALRGQHSTRRRTDVEERAIRMLHRDPEMRRAFVNRVAAPIANKLFECGLIP